MLSIIPTIKFNNREYTQWAKSSKKQSEGVRFSQYGTVLRAELTKTHFLQTVFF